MPEILNLHQIFSVTLNLCDNIFKLFDHFSVIYVKKMNYTFSGQEFSDRKFTMVDNLLFK